jgi:hypothetical protein
MRFLMAKLIFTFTFFNIIPKANALKYNLKYKIRDIFLVDFERSCLLRLQSNPQS